MSLVDYASSSSSSSSDDDDDHDEACVRIVAQKDRTPALDMPSQSQTTLEPPNESTSMFSAPTIVLPDASLLLGSPPVSSNVYGGSDHSSRVAVAMAASRKRESNGLATSLPRNKNPRGTLPRSKIPDVSGDFLVPPQLGGRSNVVTEDIGKLFVKRKQTAPSTE